MHTPVLGVCRLCRAYDASVFETTIRVLGGMLTAYELSNDRIFLTRCAHVPSHMTGGRTSPRRILCAIAVPIALQ